jgi:hypothetical protein
MVARDVVEILVDIHADPFQSGFDSQHRQDARLGLGRMVVWLHRVCH